MTLTEIVESKSLEECRELLLRIAGSYEHYPSYLSYRSDYARGYKDAWYNAYDNMRDLFNEM